MLNTLTAIFLTGYGVWGIVLGIRNKGNKLWGSIRYDSWEKKYGRQYINASNIVWGIISLAIGIFLLSDK